MGELLQTAPALSRFAAFFEMGLTSLPPIWTMSLNILLFSLEITP